LTPVDIAGQGTVVFRHEIFNFLDVSFPIGWEQPHIEIEVSYELHVKRLVELENFPHVHPPVGKVGMAFLEGAYELLKVIVIDENQKIVRAADEVARDIADNDDVFYMGTVYLDISS